jgi:hypothetical protein
VNFFFYPIKCALVLLYYTAILYPIDVSGIEQKRSDTAVWPINIPSVIDTVLTSDGEQLQISYMDGSYLLLQPNSSVNLRAVESDASTPGIRVELLYGELFIHAMNQPAGLLNVLVNENLVTVSSANAGVNRSGFFWVEAGQLQIISLVSGNQVNINKGMYAQSSGAGEIVSGNLSTAEIHQLSASFGVRSGSGNSRSYMVEFSESGEMKLREITGQALNN